MIVAEIMDVIDVVADFAAVGFFVLLIGLLFRRFRNHNPESGTTWNDLLANEEQERTILDGLPELIWVSGPDQRCVHVNNPAVEYTGHGYEQLLDFGWLEYVHPSDVACCRETYQAAFDARQSFSMEHRMRRHDGVYRWMLNVGTPSFAANGEFAGCVVACIDITERRQAEDMFRERDQAIRTTDAPIAFGDLEGRITCANQAFADLFGFDDPEQVVGLSNTNFESEPVSVADINRSIRDTGRFVGEVRLKKLDGSPLEVQVTATLFNDADGNAAGMMVAITDLTARRQAERGLQKSEHRFRTLIENASEGIVIMDVETGKLIMSNPAANRIHGLTAEELTRYGPLDVSAPLQADGVPAEMKVQECIAAALAGEQPVLEWVFRTLQGKETPCEIRLLSMELEGRTVIRGSCLDISERKRVQELIKNQHELVAEELKKTRHELVLKTRLAAIGQVSAQIAHEMRNPLGAINNAIYFLQGRRPRDEAKLREYLQLIDDEAKKCNRFIEDLLNVTRTREPETRVMCLQNLVENVIRRRPIPKHIEVEVDCDSVEVFADQDQLGQVFDNLLKNSLDAIAEQNASIRVTAHNEDDDVIIHFRDNAGGIAPDVRDSIFDVLFSTKSEGTGLGLSICRQILQAHGGSIALLNTDSTGTTFEVRLPRAAAIQSHDELQTSENQE